MSKIIRYFDSRLKTVHTWEELNSSEGLLNLILQILLVIYLTFMTDNGYLNIFMPFIIVPGILFKRLRVNPFYWIVIFGFGATFYLVLDLVGYVPNHKHIFAYAMLSVILSLFLAQGNYNFALNFMKGQAKYIIGFCFLFATIGKFLAPEFLNSSFFDFTNTTDPRFFGSTSFIGDIDLNLLKENEANLSRLRQTNDLGLSYELKGADSIEGFGYFLTYWTILIEGLIAISFIIPQKFYLSRIRDIFLVTFILTTYPIATVLGFATILALLGFIQSLKERPTVFSWFYLSVFLLLPLNYLPFNRVMSLLF
ncbi:hypothetical protein [Muriicola soli]|uniref:Uncharacterized protein n=1 Tax=Muriicola soli TaxID=2507538 RepID=A0A411E831_9FLAO|nr:hypothetical protein [Muriicola soli]QBA63885.1 hypothetical protein EQY75_04635 [Muriicola soli]